MNVLAIDTSGPAAGVAVLKEGKLTYEAVAINKLTHSVNLMPMVEQGLIAGGVSMDEIGLIACVTGPGSFTGVRIGVSTAKAVAHAKNIPCVAVDALEALAQIPFEGVICPILDARAGQVYGAAFAQGKRLMADTAMKLTDYLEAIKPMGELFLFPSDGVETHREAIAEAFLDKAVFLPAHMNHLRPAAAAYLGLKKQETRTDYLQLVPMYLRAPQAEREREAREQSEK